MAKKETRPCIHCGHVFAKDKGQCPSCKQWTIERPAILGDGTTMLGDSDGEDDDLDFIATGPWDPCFGRLIKEDGTFEYGIPRSALALLGGKNGAGKSTLVLQVCEEILEQYPDREVLIVSVEEPKRQVRRLGKRLKLKHMNRVRISKGDVDLDILLYKYNPVLVVIDSGPKLCPDPDSLVQFCKRLKDHIEELNVPAIVINHINKEEEFAGLESLQHEVDATLIFTVYDDGLRSLRSLKNRNGMPAEVYFDMTDTGLVENTNPLADDEEEDDED